MDPADLRQAPARSSRRTVDHQVRSPDPSPGAIVFVGEVEALIIVIAQNDLVPERLREQDPSSVRELDFKILDIDRVHVPGIESDDHLSESVIIESIGEPSDLRIYDVSDLHDQMLLMILGSEARTISSRSTHPS